jgi:hypothetical protein
LCAFKNYAKKHAISTATLNMDGSAFGVFSRFHKNFRKRRVSMDVAANLGNGQLVLPAKGQLREQF